MGGGGSVLEWSRNFKGRGGSLSVTYGDKGGGQERHILWSRKLRSRF